LFLSQWGSSDGRLIDQQTLMEVGFAWSTLTVTQAATGAACCNRATGACGLAVTEADCLTIGGTMGDAMTCTPNPCPPPPGACCHAAACQATIQSQCNGSWQGGGTTCTPAPGVNPCCRADINNSGTVSVQDIFDFLAMYFRGCP
jgi:hypothetical protein